MFSVLKLILMPVFLGHFLGLIVPSLELTVHVGDSALMGCVSPSTEEKRVSKVDWLFSSEHVEDDYSYVLFYYSNLSVPTGRFQNRVSLVGDVLRSDGSLLLQNVEEADQGNYTCEIRLERESQVVKKTVQLHVLPEEPKELKVHVGDSTQMRCAFPSTEEKLMTRVDWTFSSREHSKEEVALRYLPNQGPQGLPRNWGRFHSRLSLVGDTAHNDGSIMLQGVKDSDGGSYTCSIHLGNLTFRKTIVLHVIRDGPPDLLPSATPAARGLETLGGNHLVIIVGIVCATILLLPVLILVVKRTHRSKSSETCTAPVKSLEDTQKAHPEKHIYFSISTREVTKEEESSEKPEATYMTMHPVRPSLRSAPHTLPERKSYGGFPKTEHGF